MPGQHFQLFDRAILSNNGVQSNSSGNSRLARQWRILRLHLVHQFRGGNVAALANTGLRRLGRRRRSAYSADHAADDAAHLPASDTTNDTTLHAHAHVRSVFLNNLDVLRDDLRRDQFPGIHQMYLRLHVHNLRNGRRRRRWRRRRSNQQSCHHGLWQRLGIDQRNQNQHRQKSRLKNHGKDYRPRFIRLRWIRTRDHHLVKHGYLLPAGARRPEAPAPARVLPAADPELVARPWPRHRFQATTNGAAIPKLEYVPTTIPTTRAKEKARSTCPPSRNKTSTVRKVSPLVKIVRESV